MEKAWKATSHSVPWIFTMMFSFLVGFQVSYKDDSFFEPIHFLFKCFIWVFEWMSIQLQLLIPRLPQLYSFLQNWDHLSFELFFSFLAFYSLVLFFHTGLVSITKPLLSRSDK
jgi:hypothetical protein